jgi:hypothetical protein
MNLKQHVMRLKKGKQTKVFFSETSLYPVLYTTSDTYLVFTDLANKKRLYIRAIVLFKNSKNQIKIGYVSKMRSNHCQITYGIPNVKENVLLSDMYGINSR